MSSHLSHEAILLQRACTAAPPPAAAAVSIEPSLCLPRLAAAAATASPPAEAIQAVCRWRRAAA